jgi:hypothetical protein
MHFTIQEIIMNKFFIASTLIVATLPVTAVAAETDTTSRLGEDPAIIEASREMGEHPAVLVARAGTWAQTAIPTMGSGAGQWTLPTALSGVDGATAAGGLTLADGLANANAVGDRFALGLYAEAPREMGEHPAVLVARTWSKRGYDYASKMYPHPARLELYAEAPRETGEHPAVLVARTWSKRGYDYASKMYPHPARLTLYAEAPREMGEHPAVLVARTCSKRGYDEASKIASHSALSKAAAVGVPKVGASQEPQS